MTGASTTGRHDPLGIVGTTIEDKYYVETVVGEGGFGIVYRARHKIWNQPVAIKCFKALMDLSGEAREALLKDFIQEGALLSQLSGRTASIVQARDVGTFTTANGTWVPFMVLEWLDGRTLEAVIDDERAAGRGAWPIERAVRVLDAVAQALEVVHRRNIAHRDIKPANIFVLGELGTDDMMVKVLDFGIAKVVEHMAGKGSFTKTSGAVTSFTPGYGAPEQFTRTQGATGPWTDVYALALVLSELISGRPPLVGDDFIQLGMATSDPNHRPTPRTLGANVSDAVEQVMLKALAVKPQARFATAGEMWNALRTALHMPAMTLPKAGETAPGATGVGGVSADPMGAPALAAAQTVAAPSSALLAAQTGSGASTGHVAARTAPTATNTSQPVEHNAAGPASTGRRSSTLALLALGAAAIGAVGFFFVRSSGSAERATSGSMAGSGANAATTAGAATAGAGGAAAAAGSAATIGAAATAVASAAPPASPCPSSMVHIEGGKFYMGSDEPDANDNERPAHQVTLSPYCIDKHEVTVGAYKACSDEGECKRAPFEVDWKGITPKEKKVFSTACNAGDAAARAEHPINCVDWDMAEHYCQSRGGGRLPTEAEWEFAARGKDGRKYPWGDEAPDKTRMNACGKECLAWGVQQGVAMGVNGKGMYDDDDGFALTSPVGSFPDGQSRYGLLDVVGNVWEWTADWQGKYKKDQDNNPKGPPSGDRRIVRGGAFNGALPSWVRPTQRYSDDPKTHSHAYGFRCAKGL